MGALVVTIFPDDNKEVSQYRPLRKEPIKDSFLSPRIKLIEVTAIKRVGYTCCNPTECMEVVLPTALSMKRICRISFEDIDKEFGNRTICLFNQRVFSKSGGCSWQTESWIRNRNP